MKFRINIKSLVIFLLLLLLEVIIAKTANGFIRHTFGDFLVVILLYYFVKSFLEITSVKLIIYVLLFSYTIEILQSFKFVKLLGMEDNRLANIIIGNTFSYGDLLAYTLGGISVYFIEKIFNKKV